MSSYLAELTLRLTAGAARLPDDWRRRHAAFLAESRNADGGFSGREGPSNPYYTSFALRGLAVLGALDAEVGGRAGQFLGQQIDRPLPSIDFLALVFGAVTLEAVCGLDVFAQRETDRARAVALFLDRYRRDDGGYAKTPASPTSSTYHTFLVVACRQLVGLPADCAEPIVSWARSRHREDGGFVEIPPVRESGTNPTCAAVALLRILDALDASTSQRCARFLAAMQTPEGGLRANQRVPVADLLSTFTGLAALADLGHLSAIDQEAARRYAERLELPGGGFRGGVWDNAADVEYTFYGLGVLALLASPAGKPLAASQPEP